jgi:hypothetical protein
MFRNWLNFTKESRLRRRIKLEHPELFTDDVLFILRTIHEQLAIAKRGIEARTNEYWTYKLKVLSERYTIDCRYDKQRNIEALMLYDCFLEQKT